MKRDSDIETLLEEILVDAYGEDEQLWAFRQVIEDEVSMPTEGAVIGRDRPGHDYDGNPQRGLRVTCRKPGGKTYEVALEDVEFPEDSKAAPYVAAYRKWLGVPPPAKLRRAGPKKKAAASRTATCRPGRKPARSPPVPDQQFHACHRKKMLASRSVNVVS